MPNPKPPNPKPVTRQEYARRIDRVATAIAERLDEALTLEDLAALAAFSPYHFHRLYRAMSGETVTATLRRLRLHRAAGDLLHGDRPLTEIARRAGFGSVAAFSRSFRAAYGNAPGAYRDTGRPPPAVPHPAPEDPTMYLVEIRDLEPLTLAAIRHTGSYMQIGSSYERLYAWAAGRGLIGPATRAVALYHDDPGTVPEEALRSDAGIVLPPGIDPGPEVRRVEVAGGRHAVIVHQGPYAELEGPYRWLYGTWLPQSGETPADRPVYEEYLNNPRDLPPTEWRTAICLPLADKR